MMAYDRVDISIIGDLVYANGISVATLHRFCPASLQESFRCQIQEESLKPEVEALKDTIKDLEQEVETLTNKGEEHQRQLDAFIDAIEDAIARVQRATL